MKITIEAMPYIRAAVTLLALTGLAIADEPPQNAKHSIRVVVLDPQGKPLPGSNILANVLTEEKVFERKREYKTDAAGAAEIALPKTFTILRLWASKDHFVSMFANWEQAEIAAGNGPPAEYTFRLESGVSAGGRVVDEHGKPIAGAKVDVRLSGDPMPPASDGRVKYNTWLAYGTDAVKTDSEGRWHVDNVPNPPEAKLGLQVFHPDYISDGRWEPSKTDAGRSPGKLRETAPVTLKRGVIVTGRVTDPTGQPIKDAIVIVGDRPYNSHLQTKFATDGDGRYRLSGKRPGHTTLSAMAPGLAPQLRKVNLVADLPPQDFRMAPGKPIHIQVVDQANEPLPKSFVSIIGWKGSEAINSAHNPNQPKAPDTQIPKQCDANGEWLWSSAPDDPVKLQISRKGFPTEEIEIVGGAPARTVVLKGQLGITGLVTDAVTGKPIPSFSVMRMVVFRKDNRLLERNHAVPGKDGQFNFDAMRNDYAMRSRIEAKGYRSQTGPEFRVGDEAALTQHFRLQPSPPITGVVLNAAGQPAAKARVVIATPTEQADFRFNEPNNETIADETGRFEFPNPGEPFVVIASNDAGFARTDFPANQQDAGQLRLRPWATVRGQFRDGGKPIGGATILLHPIGVSAPGQPFVDLTQQVKTGPDGRFELHASRRFH